MLAVESWDVKDSQREEEFDIEGIDMRVVIDNFLARR